MAEKKLEDLTAEERELEEIIANGEKFEAIIGRLKSALAVMALAALLAVVAVIGDQQTAARAIDNSLGPESRRHIGQVMSLDGGDLSLCYGVSADSSRYPFIFSAYKTSGVVAWDPRWSGMDNVDRQFGAGLLETEAGYKYMLIEHFLPIEYVVDKSDNTVYRVVGTNQYPNDDNWEYYKAITKEYGDNPTAEAMAWTLTEVTGKTHIIVDYHCAKHGKAGAEDKISNLILRPAKSVEIIAREWVADNVYSVTLDSDALSHAIYVDGLGNGAITVTPERLKKEPIAPGYSNPTKKIYPKPAPTPIPPSDQDLDTNKASFAELIAAEENAGEITVED